MEIKNINGEIIFKADKDNIKDTVEDAVKSVANLKGANLYGANLKGANLKGANLKGADLYGANLYCANLYGADLKGADLKGADLKGANLYGAYLKGANLKDADLYGANLIGANLYCADLKGADLKGADLKGADLYGANLKGADLKGANLYGADLKGADLKGADLKGANLKGAKNISFIPIACPSDGEFTGWKKVYGKLIELRIPADAKRSSATTEKCRCDKAIVVSITDIKTGDKINEIINHNYTDTIYLVGEMVYPDSFDEDRWKECSNGIHFFTNKESAINY